MSNRYQSEYELENKLIKYLVDKKDYERVAIKGMEELEDNLRINLNKLNKDVLNGKPLSDSEFERILVYLMGKSVYQSAKQLRDKFLLIRDDQSEAYISFISFENPSKNNFQVANQITVKGTHENRYDVTILCNGFPIVQVELKRRGMAIKQAFNQVCRYARHTYGGLFKYIQIFVISNGVNTKYFANSDQHYKFEFTFYWTDVANNRKSHLVEFSEEFFEHKHLIDMLNEYMIINDTDKALMVMRPYQIWATKALVKQALETANNSYIWHSTGSGKSLVGFKTAQILAKNEHIKKVVFVVDRQDLDAQSVEEFNKFEKDSVDTTDNTRTLIKQLKDNNNTLIVTTVQKLYKAVSTERYAKSLEYLENEKIIFIVDECHRTQFGEMNTQIRRFFKKAQYFGFTGTPRFAQNAGPGGMKTSDIFGRCLHTYLLKDAISDNNVLGFSVEYIKTFEGQFDEDDDEKVYGINKAEVFESNERIELVANHIVQYYDAKTVNRKYNALFSVPSINVLIKYYDTFKSIDHDLRIGAVFSYQANMDLEEGQEHHQDALLRIMQDYNKEYGTSFDISSYGAYKKDITKRLKKKDIDLVIVVNQLLTGFDSKVTNSLFVDKNLEYHDLLQAYSRTNRVFETQKLWGNIICYRNLKKNTDEAIKLFNNSDNTDIVIQRDFNDYLKMFREALNELYKITPTPCDVDKLKGEKEKVKFVHSFKRIAQLLLALNTFVEFEFDDAIIGIDEQTYEDFKSKYLDIYEETKTIKESPELTSVLDDIDFNIELIQTDRINFDYIMNLIRNIDFENAKQREKDVKNISKELDRTDNPLLKKKVELIKAFLDEVVPVITKDDNVDNAYTDFENKRRKEEIDAFAKENDIPNELVEEVIAEYEFTNIIDHVSLSSKIKKGYLKTREIINNIVEFVMDNVEKYQ
ncbi:MAG: type I restriction endonuclease subunit R [Epulopiscium sp.]|nr:type I restriction endonuclease subunit R [Candidatus Epulonipiscium sp.]